MAKRYIIEEDKLNINNDRIEATGEEVHHIKVMRYEIYVLRCAKD